MVEHTLERLRESYAAGLVRIKILEDALRECATLAGAEVGDDDDWRALTNKATFTVDAVGQLRADYEEAKHGQ